MESDKLKSFLSLRESIKIQLRRTLTDCRYTIEKKGHALTNQEFMKLVYLIKEFREILDKWEEKE